MEHIRGLEQRPIRQADNPGKDGQGQDCDNYWVQGTTVPITDLLPVPISYILVDE